MTVTSLFLLTLWTISSTFACRSLMCDIYSCYFSWYSSIIWSLEVRFFSYSSIAYSKSRIFCVMSLIITFWLCTFSFSSSFYLLSSLISYSASLFHFSSCSANTESWFQFEDWSASSFKEKYLWCFFGIYPCIYFIDDFEGVFLWFLPKIEAQDFFVLFLLLGVKDLHSEFYLLWEFFFPFETDRKFLFCSFSVNGAGELDLCFFILFSSKTTTFLFFLGVTRLFCSNLNVYFFLSITFSPFFSLG